MVDVLGFSGFGLAIFALMSNIVSVALDYWTYYVEHVDILLFEAEVTSYNGLWKACTRSSITKQCDSISGNTDLNAVRAMLILALLLILGAIVCGGLKLFMMKTQKMLGYIAAGLLGVAGLFMMVGFALYVDKIFQPLKDALEPQGVDVTLHAGFALCIIAWLASWAAAGLSAVATMMAKE